MDVEPFSENKERIAVWIYGPGPFPDEIIEPILWGLEEEGIPADLQQVPSGPAEALAKQAADGSPLNVGIGINGSEEVVALHHRDLPGGRPLFLLGASELNHGHLRRLGANAARLVKGEPLAFEDEFALNPEIEPAARFSQDRLEEIAALVLSEIRNGSPGFHASSWCLR
jgi:hypothetical protein